MGAEADGDPSRPTTEWVYDLRGLDLAAWAARADEELGALSHLHDSVLLLVGDAEADALADLEAVLARAGYPARAATVAGIRALIPALPGAPS